MGFQFNFLLRFSRLEYEGIYQHSGIQRGTRSKIALACGIDCVRVTAALSDHFEAAYACVG